MIGIPASSQDILQEGCPAEGCCAQSEASVQTTTRSAKYKLRRFTCFSFCNSLAHTKHTPDTMFTSSSMRACGQFSLRRNAERQRLKTRQSRAQFPKNVCLSECTELQGGCSHELYMWHLYMPGLSIVLQPLAMLNVDYRLYHSILS